MLALGFVLPGLVVLQLVLVAGRAADRVGVVDQIQIAEFVALTERRHLGLQDAAVGAHGRACVVAGADSAPIDLNQ